MDGLNYGLKMGYISPSYEASKGMQSAAKRLTGFDIVCLILTSIK